MKKIIYDRIDEVIYTATLKNGVKVYLYPTTKSKNFLASVTVKYGGGVKSYSINNSNKYTDIIPGSAHFLEHKIMNFNKKDAEEKINNLGLYANAYTSYEVTNYNMYGSNNIKDSLKLLFDLFYNPNINEKNVNSEKGIITEEFEMYNNTPSFRINMTLNKNVFYDSFLNNVLVGNKEEISNINYKDLLKIYKDFYTTDNTFITIVGNFNKDEIMNYIEEYMKNIKTTHLKDIKIKRSKEKYNTVIPYMEMEESISVPRVKYAIKVKKSKLSEKNLIKRRYYLNFLLSSLFSNTSILYDEYKQSGLMMSLGYTITDAEDYYLITITAISEEPTNLINRLKSDLKSIKIDESTFNRKKKMFVNNLILGFENIEDVEYMITNNIYRVGKLINNSYEILDSLTYKGLNDLINSIDFENTSILKVLPKKK